MILVCAYLEDSFWNTNFIKQCINIKKGTKFLQTRTKTYFGGKETVRNTGFRFKKCNDNRSLLIQWPETGVVSSIETVR
jgi:hypothetical protein